MNFSYASILILFLLSAQPINGKILYEEQIFKLLSSGLTQIFWETVNIGMDTAELSSACREAVNETITGFERGHDWAYRLLDASSKSASGVLDGTFTSFGDYDQCLKVRNDHFEGSYCLIQLEMERSSSSPIGQAMAVYPFAEWYRSSHALCLPSKCSEADVRTLIESAFVEYSAFKVHGNFSCDTRENVSYSHRSRSLSTSQKIAMTFIGIILFLAIIATLRELFTTTNNSPVDLLKAFSAYSNTLELFRPSRPSNYLYLLDLFKTVIVMGSIGGHSICCFETIAAWLLTSRYNITKQTFKSFWAQGFLNENGLGIFPVMGGFMTYWTIAPLIKTGQFGYFKSVFNRWFKFVPAVMSLVALELLWSFLFSGPLYTQTANHIHEKCTKSAWMNFLFLQNYKSAPDACANHLFYSSIDLQLFLIAPLVVYTLCKRPKLGFCFAAALIALGNLTLGLVVWKYGSSPVMMEANVSVPRIVRYLNFAHFATYGHLSNYFSGVLVAYTLKETNFAFELRPITRWALIIYSNLIISIGFLMPALHNIYNVITPELVPIYLIAVRFMYTSSNICAQLFFYPYIVSKTKEPEAKKSSPPTTLTEPKLVKFDLGDVLLRSTLFNVLSKLSLAMYMVNYYVIRLDFFTSRGPLGVTPYTMSKRAFSSTFFVVLAAFFFHILFIVPISKLQRKLLKNN